MPRDPRTTILGYVAFTFIGYFTIGLALAVLPVFIHHRLGYNTILAGIVISLQYVTTFLFRGYAGNLVDKQGPKPAVVRGLTGFAASGVLLFLAGRLSDYPAFSLAVLIGARLLTGFGEGLSGASPINWAILAVGDEYTAKTISFNGIASYGALAAGAPCGVIIERSFGLGGLGVVIFVISSFGLFFARKKTPLKGRAAGKERQSFLKVLKIVAPYGICLGLGGLGFGSISTFITLYFASFNWQGAVWGLSTFGILFVTSRLLFERFITTYGGIPTSLVCLAIEALGLLVLWQAPNPLIAVIGTGIAGLGFSLVFPALGVEAVGQLPPSNKGAALAGYGLFIDLSLGITGPLIGAIAGNGGMKYIYAFSMAIVLTGFGYVLLLYRRQAMARRNLQ